MRRKTSGLLVVTACAGFALSAGPAAWAHHSNAAHDQSKTQTVTGVVKEVRLVNPHAYLILTAPDPSTRQPAEWKLEGGGVYALAGMGIKRGMIKVGDTVTVTGHPNRDGSPGGTFDSLTLNGRTYGKPLS